MGNIYNTRIVVDQMPPSFSYIILSKDVMNMLSLVGAKSESDLVNNKLITLLGKIFTHWHIILGTWGPGDYAGYVVTS